MTKACLWGEVMSIAMWYLISNRWSCMFSGVLLHRGHSRSIPKIKVLLMFTLKCSFVFIFVYNVTLSADEQLCEYCYASSWINACLRFFSENYTTWKMFFNIENDQQCKSVYISSGFFLVLIALDLAYLELSYGGLTHRLLFIKAKGPWKPSRSKLIHN